MVGLINIQFAIKDQVIYMIEANPRASRTVPFVVEGHGRSAGEVPRRASWRGRSIAGLGLPADDRRLDHFSVKEAVMPFGRFPGADTVLGARDEVDGRGHGHCAATSRAAYAKTQLAIELRAARRRHGVHQRVRPRQARHRLRSRATS